MLKNDCCVLSVIIPVYNCEKYLERAVNSVLNQPCGGKLEVIIIDDGSKDNSGLIADKIAEDNKNVKVYHKENAGVSPARNFGINNASGKYIAFLDSDDWWEKDFLNVQLCNDIENCNLDLLGFSYNSINHDYKYIKTRHVSNEEIVFEEKELGRYSWYSFCSFMYNRLFLMNNNLKFLATKVNEDQPFVEMCFYLANGIKYIDKIIFTYWSNQNSCLHTVNPYDYYINKKVSFNVSKAWFANYGVDYDIEFSIFMISDEILFKACAFDKLKKVKNIFFVSPFESVL